MTDRRDTPFNGRVAHVSLKGQVATESFVEGETVFVEKVWTDLLREPGGARERQLLRGEAFRALERVRDHVFGFAERDGYVGWIAACDLGEGTPAPTHWVSARQTYAKESPELKATERPVFLPFGARLTVRSVARGWARTAWAGEEEGRVDLYVPEKHLRPLTEVAADPVAIAALFRGTPYLWGGNSAFGIDCSGLIQAAMLACGIPCPGDSDQQADALGEEIPLDAPRRRGDIYFWEGHVGILSAPDTLLHANAHHMMVAEEPLEEVIARIAAAEGKGVACRRRATPPPGSASSPAS